MYNSTDSVTLNGDQMNTLVYATTSQYEKAKLILNERLYLKKIVQLKRELRLSQERERKYLTQLRECCATKAALTTLNGCFREELGDLRSASYELGKL